MFRDENQLDATECFIALIICSTCFGHLYAHHQELETILVLLPHMVCNVLVAGGRLLGAERQAIVRDEGNLKFMNFNTVYCKRILRITIGTFSFVSLLYGFGKLRKMVALRLTGKFLRCLHNNSVNMNKSLRDL